MLGRNQLVAAGLSALGWTTSVLKLHRQTVFCFHSVTGADATGYRSRMAVRVSFVVGLARSLRRAGVPVVALPDAVRRLRQGDTRPFVVLTFDDGYRDNYEILYPAMRDHRIPFTIFVTTGLIDRELPMWWDAIDRMSFAGESLVDPRLEAPDRFRGDLVQLTDQFRHVTLDRQREYVARLARRSSAFSEAGSYDMALTWPMLREMQASGLLTVGAHSCTHPLFRRLTREEVLAEMRASRWRIEDELNAPVPFFAYPFGQADEIGVHGVWAAGQAGFDAAFTTEARPWRPDDAGRPLRLPRILLSAKARKSGQAIAYMGGAPAAFKRVPHRDASRQAEP